MSSPVPEVDYTATVQRPSWTQLPHAVRRAVGAAAGSPVAPADDPPGSGLADERCMSLFDRLASGAATVTWGQPH